MFRIFYTEDGWNYRLYFGDIGYPRYEETTFYAEFMEFEGESITAIQKVLKSSVLIEEKLKEVIDDFPYEKRAIIPGTWRLPVTHCLVRNTPPNVRTLIYSTCIQGLYIKEERLVERERIPVTLSIEVLSLFKEDLEAIRRACGDTERWPADPTQDKKKTIEEL